MLIKSTKRDTWTVEVKETVNKKNTYIMKWLLKKKRV